MNREGVRNAYNSLDCETALRLPDVYTVDLDSGENTCLHVADAPPFPAGHHASGIMVTNDDMPIELDPNPVRTPSPSTIVGTWQPEIYLLSDENHRNPLSGSICQGTPFVLRIGHFVQRIRVTITLGSMGKENRVKTLQESFVPMYPRPR
jgi:hypothetical protein